MYPGAAGRHEIAIYPHIEGRFPYRNGGVFRIGDMVAEQRCTGDLHQEQGARFVATRQPVAFKFEVTFHIDVDGTTADFVFHDAQRVYPDAIGQHYTAYRTEKRRVGKECVSTCRYRWSRYHSKKKKH